GKLRDLSEELFICKEELEVSLSNNKDATESRTIFLSHLSHEIRTHINAIMGYLQLLKKEKVFDNFTYKTRDYLQGISISSDNLVELITNVLNLSRIESGKLEIKEENVNIKLLLQGIYHLNKSKAIKKSINFNYSFDPDVPEYIYADRGKLNRILTNLSNNAIKLSSHGRKINLKISHLEDKLIFSIHCEGVNLAAEIKQSLFDYNIKDYEFREFDYIKTSLGFYTAKQMAKLMGGVFEIQTESGDGCKLLLSIHYIASEPKLETVSTEISYKSELIYNILIIDDDLFNLEILESLFSNLGMNVEKSDNPHNIFKKLSNFKADLILVDMNMPLMNGVDLAKQIKESDDFKSIPIIGMSADIYLYQDKNIEEQFVDFIYKPVDFSQLQDKVNQILGNKKTENASDSQIMYPPDLQMKIKAHLTKIKAIPLFFPEKIFSEMKLIEELCETNKLAPPKLLSQIKEAIYNRRSSDIPSLLETEGHV
ncbi:MAG: response regulator, partial [Leptospiraceae bacterium]|nr:response regulator [Leptospiraceae bacterium]